MPTENHDNDDVPWGYSERTNVGLLASAHDKDGGVSMVELPFKRRAGQADEGAGRFDVWLARTPWQVCVEAKQAWAPACNDERIAEFRDFESRVCARHDKRSRTFQTSFALPASEIREVDSAERHVRPRAFPGAILCGRIHKAGAN